MGYRKGDRCLILEGARVQHYDCDMYADGVITDVRTGKIVKPMNPLQNRCLRCTTCGHTTDDLNDAHFDYPNHNGIQDVTE